MKKMIIGMILSLTSLAFAAPAVLFDEVEVKDPIQQSPKPKRRPQIDVQETEIAPSSQRSTFREPYLGEEFASTLELRTKRRVGVGAVTAGATGLLGAMLEFNLTPSESAIAAFGGGPGFNSFNFQWKHVFGGAAFSPYAGIGYARWYNSSSESNIDETTPSVLGANFLTEEEKRTGEFGVDLITPTIGLQYNQLFGRYTGTGMFVEVTFLTHVEEMTPIPTGALGVLYYF